MTPRRRLGGGQMDFDSSDMAFWDDFGTQIDGQGRPMWRGTCLQSQFSANSDFVRPYIIFIRFCNEIVLQNTSSPGRFGVADAMYRGM